jgi:hypothetical protein
VQIPQVIERHQTGRRIGTAATQTAAHGYALEHADVCAQGAAGGGLQRSSRAHAKIGILGHIGELDDATNPAIGANLDGDLIAKIDELKTGL